MDGKRKAVCLDMEAQGQKECSYRVTRWRKVAGIRLGLWNDKQHVLASIPEDLSYVNMNAEISIKRFIDINRPGLGGYFKPLVC